MSLLELKSAIDAVEEAYELMLAYAAQGLDDDQGSNTGAKLRSLLGKADEAMGGLAGLFRTVVEDEDLEPKDKYEAFIAVLEQDVARAKAAVQLTLAQPAISSQLIDNLNASIHLRTLLTGVFLVDEIIQKRLASQD